MNTTAVASIILGIVTIVLSVLLGKKSGQKEAIDEQLEGVKAQLSASQKETQLAKENATEAQEKASEAKSQLSKANVLAKQTAIETGILDSVKTNIISFLQNGAKTDSTMQGFENRIENARERNDINSAIEVMRQMAEYAVQNGMSQTEPSCENEKENNKE